MLIDKKSEIIQKICDGDYEPLHSINPVKKLITATKWDGIDRLEDFFNLLQVRPEWKSIKKICLKKFLLQVVCITCHNPLGLTKSSLILVLQGKKGLGKSTFLRNLLPPEVADSRAILKIVDIGKNYDKIKKSTSCYVADVEASKFLAPNRDYPDLLILPVLSIKNEKFDILQLYAQLNEEVKAYLYGSVDDKFRT